MKLLKISVLCSLFSVLCLTANAQKEITSDMLQALRDSYKSVGADKALDNAVAANDPKILALNTESKVQFDTNFSHKVNSKGITDQKGSGRCWLFSALNVLRAPMIAKNNLGSFTFSQSYCFFYDQLEKSNLFLQAIIDNARKPMDDRTVEWLFHNPMSDGGTFCGAIDIITKYGVVPAEVMPETYSANYTSTYSSLLKTKLREYGLTLRKLAAEGKNEKQLLAKKKEMLTVIYKMLVRSFGQPPQQFTYTLRDKDNKAISTKEYTPLSFYQEYVGKDLKNNYLMFMNDPSREMYKTYEIDLDRHTYDGTNWVFLNVPMDDIKQMAIASIKDSTMLYMSCDVGKCNDSKRGYSDPDIYNYGDIFGVDFPMNKAERISSFASSSTHAMSLMAVDLDANDKPIKWMVENSWGTSSGYNGYIVMSDRWLDEYLFRLVVEKQYVPEKLVELSKQKPTLLPAWDPLFSLEQSAAMEEQAQLHFRLEGNIGIPDFTGQLVIHDIVGEQVIDSVRVVNGELVPIEGDIPEMVQCIMQGTKDGATEDDKDVSLAYLFLAEGTTHIDGSEKGVLQTSGTAICEEMSSYNKARKEILEKYKDGQTDKLYAEMGELCQQHLSRHTSDVYGLYLLLQDGSYVLKPAVWIDLWTKMDKELSERNHANEHLMDYLARTKVNMAARAKTDVGCMFVDFAVEYEGKTTRLSDYVGKGKYVLADFWASWCAPCRAELPNIIAAYNTYKDSGLVVLGIAAWDKPEATLKAIDEEKIPYPQIINSQKIATDVYGISGIPEIILFGPDGTILARGLRDKAIGAKLAEIYGEK